MVHPKTYAYGFCLVRGRSVTTLPPTYEQVTLPGDLDLFYDSRRALTQAQTADGSHIVVHGRVHDLNDGAGVAAHTLSPAQRLAHAINTSEQAFLEVLDHLAGRFVVFRIVGERVWVYHDALGTRSVYYLSSDAGWSQAVGVASHAYLLAEVFGLGASGVLKSNHTWDLSPYRGVKALSPNHRLDAITGQVQRYWPYRVNQWIERSVDERLNKVAALWSQQVMQAVGSTIPVRFALGNGLDSYCALSLSVQWAPYISCFSHGPTGLFKQPLTHEPGFENQSVNSLVESLRLEHTIFDHRDPDVPSLTPDEEDACDRNSVDVHSRWLLPHYLTRYPDDDQLVLRAHGFDIAEHKWASHKASDVAAAAKVRLVKRAAAAGVQIPEESLAEHFNRAFKEQGLMAELYGYLASDLTHWEYRMGRWASELYNEADIVFDSFVPMSCRALLEPLLAFDREQRAASYSYHHLAKAAMGGPTISGVDQVAAHDRNRHVATSVIPMVRPPEELSATAQPVAEHVEDDSDAVTDVDYPWAQQESAEPENDEAPPLIMVTPNGVSQEINSVEHQEWFAYVPLDYFRAGAAAHRIVFECEDNGDLFLDMHTTWNYPESVQSFSYSILVDETPVLTIPGSHDAGRLPVGIYGLTSGQTVRLAILVHKDRDRISWENASRVRVSDIRFDAKAHGAKNPQGVALGVLDYKRLPLPYPIQDIVPDTAESSSSTDKWAGDELAEN